MNLHQLDPTRPFDSREELTVRSSDGIVVRLLWTRDTNLLTVAVDARPRGRFELVVEDDVDAIDVFDHPFAYAAWRGLLDAPATERVAA